MKSKKNEAAVSYVKSVTKKSKKKGNKKNISTPNAKPIRQIVIKEPPKHRKGTKQDILITLLKRTGGATIKEMAEVVGWQRHSVHGMIHGLLRTRLGMQVVSQKEQRGRVYRIA